jgi:hypothetical protein
MAVATFYVCGEPERAHELARAAGVDDLPVRLAATERDGDLARCDAVIESVVKTIVSARMAPFESSGQVPIGRWDWLEVGFAARARLAGEPLPGHREMLECAGLLGAGPSRRIVRLMPTSTTRTPARSRSCWTRATSTISRSTCPGATSSGIRCRWRSTPLSSPQERLPYEGDGLREAIAAVPDWFNADDDLGGRDGPWAARTLLEITKDLAVSTG